MMEEISTDILALGEMAMEWEGDGEERNERGLFMKKNWELALETCLPR